MDIVASLVAKALLRSGRAFVLPHIKSRQLKANLQIVDTSTSRRIKGVLRVPHYWARYYHNSRGPAKPRQAKVLVWFRNKNNDPRLRGGKYPIYKSDRRRMTRQEFKKWSRVNQQIINRYRKVHRRKRLTAADYKAMNLPMIISTRSPRTPKIVKANPFFSNRPGGGMFGFVTKSNEIAKHVIIRETHKRMKKMGRRKIVRYL